MMIERESRYSEGEDDYQPWMYRRSRIAHYHGDTVRELMLAAAALLLCAAPLYMDDSNAELPFIAIATIAVVASAALTNPRSRIAITVDTILSGVGLVVFESWALSTYQTTLPFVFILRESIAILFLFSLYFSLKTLRAMIAGTIGHHDTAVDFVPVEKPREELTDAQQNEIDADTSEKLEEHIQEEKEEYRD